MSPGWWIAVVAGLALALPASAQPTGAAPAEANAPTPTAKAPARKAARRGPRSVIEIDSVNVEGDVQKPEAFYILQRSELTFEGRTPRKSFIPLIIESVEKAPF